MPRVQIKWRLSDEPITDDTPAAQRDPAFRASTRCRIFLGMTSNMGSAGTREQIRWGTRYCQPCCRVATGGGP